MQYRLDPIYPPPIRVIDDIPSNRKGFLDSAASFIKHKSFHSAENDPISVHGENYGCWLCKATDNEQLMVPSDYCIRIYQNEFFTMIEDWWDSIEGPSPETVIILMAHLLIHEFCHYISRFMKWKDMIRLAQEDHYEAFLKSFESLREEIFERDGDIDQLYKEEHNNELLAQFVLSEWTFLSFKDYGITPIIWSRYDRFMYTKDLGYMRASRALKLAFLVNFGYIYANNSEELADKFEHSAAALIIDDMEDRKRLNKLFPGFKINLTP